MKIALFQDSDEDMSNIVKAEKNLILLTLSLRHSYTNIQLENTIHAIDYFSEDVQFKSKYRFLKNFKELKYIECYYCPECPANLNFEESVNRTECQICEKIYKKKQLKEEGFFFYYLPLKDQLIEILNTPLFLSFRKQCDENDIINGTAYKDLLKKNVIGVNDITIIWNTDGVSLFKSTHRGITPVLVFINELPYRVRKDNPLLVSLFHGNTPPMNIYLKYFVEELRELSLVGFKSSTYGSDEEINIKVHTILSSVDSVARPKVQNIKQFNGKFGCSYCYHKGETIVMGDGFSRIYRGKSGSPRSHDDFKQHAIDAVQNNKIVKGVKGTSIVLKIPHFDIIHSFPPDYMHCCLLGVACLFTTEWFKSKNHDRDWYLGLKKNEFNKRLLSIKPPTEITRVPRQIDKNYKASEWKLLHCITLLFA